MSEGGDRWGRLREIFDRAADLPPGEREELVRELTAGDNVLAREVMDLLVVSDRDDEALDRMRGIDLVRSEEVEAPGMRVGPYRLVRELGEGGMGCVYEAVREGDEFDQRVAIKVIRWDMATDALLRRFRQERQILAGLDHPNIARLLDGGSTSDGRPFLVMELVDGVSITEYCAAHGLPVPDRLRLILAVCDAVHHAHRHLVVHRDLKPDNILVAPEGTVKLLDFGVAKLLRQDGPATGRTQKTATGHRPFTPGYASPEHVTGGPVTTASDVYSLGVILYELLSGRHPFDAARPSPFGLSSPVDADPAPPSEAAGRASGANAAAGARLRKQLAGDLDNIVLKAMSREPDRRYGSVDQLAEDVRRYLAGLPVRARRGSAAYRMRKFARRHRAGVGAAGLVLVTLAGGIVATSSQARRAASERDRARIEAMKAERINAFLVEMLRSPDPWVEDRDIRVSDLLAGAAARSAEELADEPEVLAEVYAAIGMTYYGLGFFDEAEPLLANALRIRRELPGTPPADLAASLGNHASLLLSRGDLEGADGLVREALAILRPASATDTLRWIELRALNASLLQGRGQWEAAGSEQEGVLELRRRILGSDHHHVAQSLNALAVVRGQQGDYPAAERLLREALDVQTRALGPDHPDLAAGLTNLAFVLAEQHRFETADSSFRAALELRLRRLGPDHPDVAWTRYTWATMLQEWGDYAGAERNARQVLTLRGRALPDGHPLVAASLQTLGLSLAAQARLEEAEALLRESLDVRRTNLPPGHWLVHSAESVLGECLSDRGRFDEAERLLLSGYAGLREAAGEDNPRTREARGRLETHYLLRGDTARAAAYRGM